MSRAAYHDAATYYAQLLKLRKSSLEIKWPKGSTEDWKTYAADLGRQYYEGEGRKRAEKARAEAPSYSQHGEREVIGNVSYRNLLRRQYGAYNIVNYNLDQGGVNDNVRFFVEVLKEYSKLKRTTPMSETKKGLQAVNVAFKKPQGTDRKGNQKYELIWRHVYIPGEGTRFERAVEMAEAAEGISRGESQHGSDVLSPGTDLSYDTFQLTYFSPIAGGANSKYKVSHNEYYKFKDPGSNGYCLISCLRSVSEQKVKGQAKTIAKSLGYADGDLLPLEALDKLSELYNVSIPIWDGDSVEEKREVKDLVKGGNTCVTTRTPKVLRPAREGGNEPIGAIAVALTKNSEGEPHFLLVTEMKKVAHHAVTGDEMKEGAKEPTKAHIAKRLIEQGRKVLGEYKEEAAKIKQIETKLVYKERVLLYDLETIFDPINGDLKAYAVAWLDFDPEEASEDFSDLEACVRIEISETEDDEPIDKLVDYIGQAPKDVRYTLEAYNGSAFDHILLSRASCKRDKAPTNICWFGGKLISGNLGRHSFHDLCRFTATSLKSACDGFGASPKKIDGFDHSVPQAAYFEGASAWETWLTTNRDKVSKYCKTDVLALGSLFVKSRKAFRELTKGDILKYTTIAQMSYNCWSKSLRPVDTPTAPASRRLDQFFRKAYTAGRVEILKNEGRPYSVEGNLKMYDYKSLYPTVCTVLGNEFPIGPAKYATKSKNGREVEGKLGIYNCCIVKQPAINIVPKRGKDKLDWKYKGSFSAVLTSIDIGEIRKHGGRVIVRSGYYWEKSTKNMFTTYFKKLAEEKQKQDALKKAGSSDYNAPLRECCKLLMNALTGKVGQRERTKSCVVAKGAIAQHEFISKHENIETIPLYGETVIMTGDPLEDRPWRSDSAKPSFIPAFIYSYARRCLYDMLPYSEYCDTDSGLMTEENGERFRQEHPERFPSDGKQAGFGHVEEELMAKKKSHLYRAYLIQPKLYAVFAINDKGEYDTITDKKGGSESLSKIRSKGIKGGDIVLDRKEAAYLEYAGTAKELFTFHTKRTAEQACFKIERNAEALMKEMLQGRPANILCSQLKRSLGSKDGSNTFSITQRYLLKKLTTSGEEDEELAPAETPKGWKKTYLSCSEAPQKERPDNLTQ